MRKPFIYEKISGQIRTLIDQGVIKPGDKLESIRALSVTKNVSLSTAFKAYEELVIKDVIESRPKSGYYVKHQNPQLSEVSMASDTILKIRPQGTEKVIAFAHKHISRQGIVQLSVSAPDISLLPGAKLNKSMNEVLRLSSDSCLNYEAVEGNEELRRQIVRYALGTEAYNHPDDVIITQGCIESLVLCLMTITKPGDTIIIERPAYFSIYNIIKNLGLKILEVNVHPTQGLSLDFLEKCITEVKVSACIFISNFSNPTGYCMPDDIKEKLVGILAKANIPLIEDDIYGEIYFGSSRPRTCKSFDKKGLVLLCSSFSKTLAPGYRVGWCLPGKFKERFLEIKIMHTVSSASPTQAAIAQFFNSGRYDLHIKKLRKTVHLESIRYRHVIAKYFPDGTKVTSPGGGYVLWIELDRKIDATNLFYEALNRGISIWPGSIFSVSKGFRNFIRISYGTPMNQTIEAGLKLLGSLSHAQNVS